MPAEWQQYATRWKTAYIITSKLSLPVCLARSVGDNLQNYCAASFKHFNVLAF